MQLSEEDEFGSTRNDLRKRSNAVEFLITAEETVANMVKIRIELDQHKADLEK
jgi:hypothetical protein